MEPFKRALLRFLRPKTIWIVLLTIAAAVSLVFIFTTTWYETPAAYIVYVFSAYAMVVLAFRVPKLVKEAKELIHSNQHSRRYVTDTPFRTMISLYFSLAVNLVFAIFKLVTAIIYGSFWFGAVGVYYIILCVVRVFLLRHLRSGDYDLQQELRAFRNCGIFLFVLNITLTGVAYQMVHQGMGYEYPGTMIYAVASYAFYCLTMSIINTAKYRKLDAPLLSASKAINLATALVAIFTLQTAMFAAFGADMDERMKFIMNTATGSAVCLIIFVMGVLMVVRANRKLKSIKAENK